MLLFTSGGTMLLFNFGINNRMSIFDICEDEPEYRLVAYGFDGRIFGKFFQIQFSRTNQRPVFSYRVLQWWHNLVKSNRPNDYPRRKRKRNPENTKNIDASID
jgi:hypothetical protein